MKSNKLTLTLANGEGLKVEFKEKIAHLDREIVAMANSIGGSIFLGVTDEGKLCNFKITNPIKSQIIDIARNCDPSIKIELLEYPKEQVLEIKIKGNDKPYRCKDGFFIRIGANSQKLRRDEIINLTYDSNKINFDETINDNFDFNKDFSKNIFSDFLKLCNITKKFPTKDMLLSLSIAIEKNNKLKFTNAGVLFFSKDPQKFFPESLITTVLYKSNDRFSIIDKKDFKGSPITQIEQSLAFIIRNMKVEIIINNNISNHIGMREEIYDYPIISLREAIINAVTHRDYYYDGSHIYIHMYPDRIEIENPGGLYRGLTIASLGKRSVRRNRLIADLLHRAKYIERVGSGFDRMVNSLQQNNNPPLQVIATNFFNIKFKKRIAKYTESSLNLSLRQQQLLAIIQEKGKINKKTAAQLLQISEDTALRELNYLIVNNFITRNGASKATYYSLKNT